MSNEEKITYEGLTLYKNAITGRCFSLKEMDYISIALTGKPFLEKCDHMMFSNIWNQELDKLTVYKMYHYETSKETITEFIKYKLIERFPVLKEIPEHLDRSLNRYCEDIYSIFERHVKKIDEITKNPEKYVYDGNHFYFQDVIENINVYNENKFIKITVFRDMGIDKENKSDSPFYYAYKNRGCYYCTLPNGVLITWKKGYPDNVLPPNDIKYFPLVHEPYLKENEKYIPYGLIHLGDLVRPQGYSIIEIEKFMFHYIWDYYIL